MIATTDHGGEGPTVLFLHGAGGRAQDWEGIASTLTDRFHVVAVDLPGHGSSPPLDGDWNFAAVLSEIEALAFDEPALVGLSLGGMLALRWGHTHRRCPAVISIDGHRAPLTAPGNYPGLEREVVIAGRAALAATFEAMAASAPPSQARTLTGVFEAMQADDTVPLLRETRCPSTVAVATRTMPGAEAFDDLLSAYRRGVLRDLHDAARENANVTVVDLDASHAAHLEAPDEVARLVRRHVPGGSGP